MLYRAQLRQAVVNALLQANTLAGQKVYAPRDLPTTPASMPLILVQTPLERKVSLGRHAPLFTTTATVAVNARVQGATVQQVEADLETLCEQIEEAVLTDYTVLKMVQQVAAVDTEIDVTSESRSHLGEAWIRFDMEFPQAYRPTITQPLTDMELTATVASEGGPPSPPTTIGIPLT
ncbi:hypothetical protein [Chromobacterium rhizoryzae]|uniref:hypothetical protein n=1 Tax=Chromobacterium rhizoryzae TaxID=1778675 RepID=UPI001D06AF00|nr:hypothetical protein [Chromobacterium rhizoryzae]